MKRAMILAVGALFLLGATPPGMDDPDVTAVSVLPAPGSAVVVIDVTGAVTVRDFTLHNPDRIVIDVEGASLRTTGPRYDGRNRGGILDIRYAQHRQDVVRIVLEVERLTDYQLEYRDDAIRLALSTDQQFTAWSSGQLARSLAAAAARAAEPPAPTTDFQQSQQPRITVSFDSSTIQDVVAGFAALSGRSILVGPDINIIVRGEIIDQPWDVALNELLTVNGLQATEQPSGIILVQAPGAELARDSLEPKQTVIMAINNKSAISLAASLDPMVTPRGGNVIADTSTNQLIITDTRNRIAEDTLLVRQLDIPTAQVSIQAKLIFVDRTDIEELGVQYDLGNQDQFFNQLVQRRDPSTAQSVDTDGDGVPDGVLPTDFFSQNTNIIDLGGNSLSAIGNASATVLNPALELIFSTAVGNFNLTAFVNALQRVELADLQAEPLISTVDNTQARILVGERTPIRIIDAGAQQGVQGQQPVATLQFQETGITLQVTPHVTNANQILMQIHAENSSIRAAPVEAGFTFQTQEADNVILVNDGETAVIGGLTVTQVTVAKSGIPFLVDLPIVGPIFGFSSRREQRRDLLILVTPRITDSGDSAR